VPFYVGCHSRPSNFSLSDAPEIRSEQSPGADEVANLDRPHPGRRIEGVAFVPEGSAVANEAST